MRGEVVLITGGSSGIGLAAARQFARVGARVVLVARDPERLAAAVESVGSAARALPADITSLADTRRIAEDVAAHEGRLDVLVNCAGQFSVGPAEEAGPELAERLIRVNYLGAVNVIHACLPLLRAGPRRSIVNVSSLAGKLAPPYMAAYAASKFALTGYTHALRQELRSEGFHVGLLSPAPVDTPMIEGSVGTRYYPLPPGIGVISAEAAGAALVRLVRRRSSDRTIPGRVSPLARLGLAFPLLVDAVYSLMRKSGSGRNGARRTPVALLLAVASAGLTACGGGAPRPAAELDTAAVAVAPPEAAERSCAEEGARQVAEELGARLKTVSHLAADTSVARQLRTAYAPLVTPALLDRWLADPARAPGRELSSPWPERIEVDSVTAAGARECRVDGRIVYLTSQEAAQGGSADTRAVQLRVTHTDRWRVSGFDTVAARPEDVLREYYAAIDARDFRRAYALWGNDGAASGQSFDEFVAGFASTAHVTVEIGKVGRLEGAAGSRFVEVPVTITARKTDGTPQRFSGSYSLRRTVVDGSTTAQRRWHLYAAKISASP
jgi:NAD(P)-dependent dehydrogenase (short-subunit alcohol dehydrogenase family)